MKLNKILYTALMISSMGSSLSSCKDSFLDEELITQYSTDRFETQEGLDELVTGAYQKLKSSNPQLSSSASFLRLNVLSSLN